MKGTISQGKAPWAPVAGVRRILLTNRNHVRAANLIRASTGAMTLDLVESDATVEVLYARATEQSHDSSPDHRNTED